jgi:Tfp pilus assembly protein PilO
VKRDPKIQMINCTRAQCALGVVLLLVGCAIYLMGIRPATVRLGELQAKFALEKSELQGNQARARDLPKVELEIEHLRQRVERFDKKLPKQQDLAQFIDDLTEISQQSSLQKLAWKPDLKPRRTDQFSELPIQLTFQGDFAGVFDFLRRTEDMQRLTRVRKLELRSLEGSTGQVDVQVTMNIYFAEE